MTFANRFTRGAALTALALGSMGVVNAQNGTNYHVLTNSGSVAFIGVGAGATTTGADGIGSYIPGEDCRGSLQVDFGGTLGIQFSYRNNTWRERPCVLHTGTSGLTQIRMPGIYFIELDGLNANIPQVFLRPMCQPGITASFLPYGLGPSSSASFVFSGLPTALPAHTILLPDNGLIAATGTATIVAAATNVQIPAGTGTLGSAFGCYQIQFNWITPASIPTAVPYLDNIDGIWHYAVNSDDNNQYWSMSNDEMNLTRSNSVATTSSTTGAFAFDSVIDYNWLLSTMEAQTTAVIANHSINGNGPYFAQTENMTGGGGPNFGFDVGRGSRAVSFTGLGGVKVSPALGGLGNGAQDPAYGGGPKQTMGFVTWDNKPNSINPGGGSNRDTWLSIDYAQIGSPPLFVSLPPESDPDIKKGGGTVKVPITGISALQPLTSLALPIFSHTTKAATSGWPDPCGQASGAFAVPPIAGGSIQFNVSALAPKVPCSAAGLFAYNLTYGSSGKNNPGPPKYTWDPSVADISGTKELYLWK